MLSWLTRLLRVAAVLFVSAYVLIFVHELGHLVTGLLMGFEFEVFSVGNGPVLVDYLMSSGLRVHLALYPMEGFCRFSSEGVEIYRQSPWYYGVLNSAAGVLASSSVAWLVLLLSLRRPVEKSPFRWVRQTFWVTLGIPFFTPILPGLIFRVTSGQGAFVTFLTNRLEDLKGIVDSNPTLALKNKSGRWRRYAVIFVALNAYNAVLNIAPLYHTHDGFHAVRSMLEPLIGLMPTVMVAMTWTGFLAWSMLLLFIRVFSLAAILSKLKEEQASTPPESKDNSNQ